ncbi:MAG: HAD hydrolase family protein, partial [Bacteroidales bacterium]|nr:HAD hydrolase family protein [Bacteroidales bacterium]
KVIRTTSPLNGETIWMEIFPVNVSKATGVDFLRKKYDLKIESIVVIGNDFNDIDMLEYTENSYVVANAPEKLLEKYKNVESNNDNGVAKVIDMFI